ncbi:ATP-binding cassette domain-containing protein [bacterium]|nr:ATP-binding cassette domain-containing protein [bacterium]
MSLIEVKSLSFKYKDNNNLAINNLSFSLDKGRFLALMGRTGAGKSTLCFSMNGLIPNFIKGEISGEVKIAEKNVRDLQNTDTARLIGLLFQDFENQLFSTSIENEIAFLLENLDVDTIGIKEKVEELMSLLDLTELRDRDPSSLSGGQKQKVAIASILAAAPGIIILDEPFTDLDPHERNRLLELMGALKDQGKTIIFVGNEADEIMHSSSMLILNAGKIVEFGPTESIIRKRELLTDNGVKPSDSTYLISLGIPTDFRNTNKDDLPGIQVNDAEFSKLLKEDDYYRAALGESIIEADKVSFSYGNIEAVDSVDVVIRRGEFLAILGHNGSGKTTLAKLMNGLLSPVSGEMKIFNTNSREWKKKELALKVGYVFQNPDHQIFAETVLEEISFGPRNFGFESQEIEACTAEAIETLALQGYEEMDPFSLTKGERQRVAVASLLASKPQILILDEPTTGLDYKQCVNMMELLRDLNRNGYTIIIITHSMWTACQYARRTILMNDGRLIADDLTRDIFGNENILSSTHLIPPPIVEFTSYYGKTCLSLDEFKRVFTIY